MRFLADMGVAMRVVDWLRANGHEAIHLREEGLQRISDDKIFEKAVYENRIIITFDLDFGEILARNRNSVTSVVLFRIQNTTTPNVIKRFQTAISEFGNALETGAILIIEDARLRLRRLPI
jgi:predicted nuclease of predicted toxin-antitoxin system